MKLMHSPFWLKIGPCPAESDKKDLMHAISSTSGVILQSEIKGDFCRIRIDLNVKKPLRQGIFVQVESNAKVWLPFKYESLLIFCFGCGRMYHNLRDCLEVSDSVKNMSKDDLPFSVALKAESKLVDKLSQKLIFNASKSLALVTYEGEEDKSESDSELYKLSKY